MLVPQRFGRYRLEGLIAQGGKYTQVVRARDVHTGRVVACKVFSRKYPDFQSIEREIRIHCTLKHPNIAELIEVVYAEEVIFLVMQFYKRGDLFKVITTSEISKDDVLRIFMQVVDAVAYLHDKGIAHMDLKLENIFVDDENNAKLADFGCCETPESRKRRIENKGTLYYAAPEMFENGSFDNRPADIWSLGILLYALFFKHLPWEMGSDAELVQQIRKGEINYPFIAPPKLITIINSCCQLEPANRVTVRELIELVNKNLRVNYMPNVFASLATHNTLMLNAHMTTNCTCSHRGPILKSSLILSNKLHKKQKYFSEKRLTCF